MKTRRGKATPVRRRTRPSDEPTAAPQARLQQKVARLSRELKETREQQTAAAEVLGIIANSPGALEPVFEAMLANAVRLCEAKFGVLFLSEGDAFRTVALHGAPPAFAEARRREPMVRPNPGGALGRLADMRAEPVLTRDPSRFAILELAGARTMLNVPILRENELVGQIAIYRQEVRPFADKQIELLTSFAAQAGIAIENTRLLNELRESLQRQTATSEVLEIISSSPGELEPVFQAMLENATRICEAKFGILFRYHDGAFYPLATLNAPPALADFLRRHGPDQPGSPYRPDPRLPLYRLMQTKAVVHTIDQLAEPVQTPSARLAGARSHIAVPMLKENELVGAISVYRQEVRPFTDKQIELVSNFAKQAVIAIENARLLNELRASLQRQTATSEVLQAISSSPGELEPIFQAMLANATRICEARIGILFRYEDGAYSAVSMLGVTPAYAEYLNRGPIRPGPATGLGRVA